MSRRTRTILALFASCCVAFCMRSPNCSLSRALSSVRSSSGDLSRRSFLRSESFMVRILLSEQPVYERRPDRQLGGGERKCFACERLVDAVHLVEHLAGNDFGDVVLRVALAVAHSYFGRLLRHRLIGINADPDPAASLDVTRHRPPRGLDLAGGQSAAGNRLEPVLAETDLGTDRRHAFVAALLLLAVLPSSWLQHSSLLDSCGRASALQVPAPGRPAARRFAA